MHNYSKKMQSIDIRTALRQALDEEMTRDSNIFIMGEEVGLYNGAYKITKGLLDKWGPQRVWDTPISENGFLGLGIGAAMTGLRPVIELMSWSFSFVAIDQILSNAATMYYMSGGRFKVPIVFRGAGGAAVQLGCQHSHSLESLYSNFPGLIIVAPSNACDAKGLLKASIRNDNPVIFLESELDYGMIGKVPTEEYVIPIGKASVVESGSDLTLVSWGRMIPICKQAVKEAAKQGIKVELIDLRTIKPLDISTIITSIMKTHRCLIVEEGHYFCGMGAEISATVIEKAFDYLDAPTMRISRKETPMPYAKNLEQEVIPNITSILHGIKHITGRL
ncbi:Pyruvate dehydrogenase E1 component subunit beta [Candidatus Clavichlamydia salmonicola]|uniref:alpha-ketoacid dehydrogenase subunit beta n=1 Tax=Candidatus Clavichlamydia salmonicola TaxID=469812 RepID=UPI001E2E2DAF|nr:alpha-ketoacid dehydrogenase subunit beta [Candidatus Clavichlamydia salmonicola]MBF5051241.1 Pyruvate dehydrogenase E1 component subunit beta [Candidatus Clavichlamydia salmonicola]